jgi:hypothetical protein
MNKAMIYNEYGIEYKAGKIYAPVFGWINPLLVNGNSKLGDGVWTFSTLAGTREYTVQLASGDPLTVKGTCICNCDGCYAQTGFYNMPSVQLSNAIKTALARMYPGFIKRAIIAQIKAENISLVRIHASGDFFGSAYIDAWRAIVYACKNTAFWTYTKNATAEHAFDDLNNINIVKSCIAGYGYNFGKCGYIITLYKALKAAGKNVYICRCGIDKNQHCVNCTGCIKNEYVLFLEHSTSYKAVDDPLYDELKAIIENQ